MRVSSLIRTGDSGLWFSCNLEAWDTTITKQNSQYSEYRLYRTETTVACSTLARSNTGAPWSSQIIYGDRLESKHGLWHESTQRLGHGLIMMRFQDADMIYR